tara:strand:- start:2058 stop:2426 length:369 start_codon:yes stop_codon:yes gene_type:complete
MKKFRFKVWDKTESKMYNWGDQHVYIPISSFGSILISHAGENSYIRSDYEILQFTGIKDINDQEIYEGDLLKGEVFQNIVEVVWDDLNACWCGRKASSLVPANFFCGKSVIGNIFETPELLK